MSSETPTQMSTKYYLYSPSTGERKEGTDDFNSSCDLADATPGIWEVHVTGSNKRKR